MNIITDFILKYNNGVMSPAMLIRNCNKHKDELYNMTPHIPIFEIQKLDTARRLYHMIHNMIDIPLCMCGNIRLFDTLGIGYCNTCGNTVCLNKFRQASIKSTCMERYGVMNGHQIQSAIDKTKNTNMGKYGVTNPLHSTIGKAKKKASWVKKYGETHPMRAKVVLDKLQNTNMEKYGCKSSFSNKDVQQKYKDNCMEKYGVDNTSKLEYVRDKVKATNLERHGFENPMQNSEIFSLQKLSARTYKDFVFPSGRVGRVQGYEPFALKILLEDYNENDLIIDNKEIESYVGKFIYYTSDGKKHRYFPDILIKSENKIIEVKSLWSYNLHLDINQLKKKACIDSNILFEFMILGKDGRYIE